MRQNTAKTSFGESRTIATVDNWHRGEQVCESKAIDVMTVMTYPCGESGPDVGEGRERLATRPQQFWANTAQQHVSAHIILGAASRRSSRPTTLQVKLPCHLLKLHGVSECNTEGSESPSPSAVTDSADTNRRGCSYAAILP